MAWLWLCLLASLAGLALAFLWGALKTASLADQGE
jgi:hypothetical protein